MNTSQIQLLDVVALTVDLPEYNLYCGQIKTFVKTLTKGTSFEVEISDRTERTYQSIGQDPSKS